MLVAHSTTDVSCRLFVHDADSVRTHLILIVLRCSQSRVRVATAEWPLTRRTRIQRSLSVLAKVAQRSTKCDEKSLAVTQKTSMSKARYKFFFFFQAEDGIRDYKVTGVQTCALPI